MSRTKFSTGTTITAAWLNRIDSRVSEIVSLKEFGAVGDGVADDTIAIQTWLQALINGTKGYAPAGTYKFTSPLTASGGAAVAIVGDGPRQTLFVYAGASTTNDLFVVGDGVTNAKSWYLANFRLDSTTTMTAGAGFRFKSLEDAVVRDVIAGGVQGNQKLWNGYHFDGANGVQVSGFSTKTRHDGIVVNGVDATSNSNLSLIQGTAGGCAGAGLRCAGNFGDLAVDQAEFIGNGVGIGVDTSVAAGGNRAVLIGANVVCDGLQAGSSQGVLIDDAAATGGHVTIDGVVRASGQNGVYVKNWPQGIVSIGASRISNCLGHGVAVEDATTVVLFGRQTSIDTNAGWGIFASVVTFAIAVPGRLYGNTLGDAVPSANVGAWSNFATFVTAASGVFGSTAASAAYSLQGRTVFLRVSIGIITNGSAGDAIRFTLPAPAHAATVGCGRTSTLSNAMLQVVVEAGSPTAAVRRYDGAYPGADGETYELSLTYEV